MLKEPTRPRQDPCRGQPQCRDKTLAEDTYDATARTTSSKAPSPFPCNCQPNQLGRHLRGDARPLGQLSKDLRGGMQIFVKTKNSQDQMRIGRQRYSARSLPRKATRPPARSLQGTTAHPGKALTKDASRAAARPAPAKSPPPFACSCQPNQLGRHLRGNMQLRGQLIKRMRGGMQIFVEAPPSHHLSCLPANVALHASLARARVEARRSGDGRDGPCSRPR